MFIYRNLNLILSLISQNPNISNPFSNRNCFSVSFPNRLSHCSIRSLMASSKIVVEYAKSNRSTCKKCVETIASKTLRLGLVSKERGFEATKWHHLNCFPMDSQSIDSVENIDGFSLLESSDQEVLKNLKAEWELLPKEEKQDEIEEGDKKNSKNSKVRKADEVAVDEHEGSNSKKRKVSKVAEATVNELEGSNSKKPKSSTTIVAEYAKSSRSSCKKCAEPISVKTLRLGLVSRDPRGFDAKKWHHINCFPIDSQPIVSVDNIDGFSSLKNNDQEMLKKLIAGCDHMPKKEEIEVGDGKSSKESKVSKADEVAVEMPEGNNSKKSKVRKADEVAVSELEGSTSKKPKASSTKIVAEYAKSNRSTCKKCEEPIPEKTLRLGLVNRDPRGFDVTKWHHLNCCPIDSQPIVSVENVDGFSSLESNDQEALKNLMAGCEFLPKEDGIDGSDEESLKESKVPKANEVSGNEFEGSNTEKPKESKLELVFSVSDVKDKYKDASLLPKWKAFQSIIFLEQDEGLHGSAKIAAFDFDGCLVNTSVKRIGADAWSLLYPSIPEKLKSLYNDGYKLVIFTNEANIERWKNKRQVAVDSKIGRLNNFIDLVKVPMQVFIACGIAKTGGQTEDPFRKPKPGMWRIMEQQFNSGIKIDMDQSFYVGDAAGRTNDHSDADIGFAKAIGLKFFVPEDYFDV